MVANTSNAMIAKHITTNTLLTDMTAACLNDNTTTTRAALIQPTANTLCFTIASRIDM